MGGEHEPFSTEDLLIACEIEQNLTFLLFSTMLSGWSLLAIGHSSFSINS